MVFADIIYTKITTDKDFTAFDEKIFETNYYLKKFTISEFIKIDSENSKNSPKNLNLTFTPFPHISRWKIRSPNEVIFENVLDERQYFFLESLIYLMNTYFKSMQMKLNGSIYGIESIFGDEFEYEIKENVITKIK